MAFLRKKEIPPGSGNYYWYLVENYREGGQVKQRVLEYRGKDPGENPSSKPGMKKKKLGTTPKQNVDLTGLADREGVKSSDVNQTELKKGIKIEMEHTKDKKVAEQIATDHLTEIPDYYTRLDKMEKQAKKKKDPSSKKEYEWYDSVIRNQISTGEIENEIELSGSLSNLETEYGMDDKIGNRLYAKYRKDLPTK